MRIQLSEHFTYKKLLRFSLPTIAMMIFTSIYGIVDGFFVSNYVGKTAFAAVNLIMPFLMIQGCFGFMIGTGGENLRGEKAGGGKPLFYDADLFYRGAGRADIGGQYFVYATHRPVSWGGGRDDTGVHDLRYYYERL